MILDYRGHLDRSIYFSTCHSGNHPVHLVAYCFPFLLFDQLHNILHPSDNFFLYFPSLEDSMYIVERHHFLERKIFSNFTLETMCQYRNFNIVINKNFLTHISFNTSNLWSMSIVHLYRCTFYFNSFVLF